MSATPLSAKLEIAPKARLDIIDVKEKFTDKLSGQNKNYKKAFYCSFHTTAGYLEQSLCSRLNHSQDHIRSFIKSFQKLFPIGANYRHDQMELRNELSDEQKKFEPKNADSHLTFMGSGLKNCVTYSNRRTIPVYFIDLDGVHEYGPRSRHTCAMFYNQEEIVHSHKVDVPVSRHPIDSVNLRDQKLAYIDKLNHLLEKYDIENGRIDITLDPSERNAGLTVNEYETLLMRHDLVEILRNPVKFMGPKGKYLLQNPHTIPARTIEYAKYDLVHLFNELMDVFQLSESMLERFLSKFIALPASRFLRMKRQISLLITNNKGNHLGKIVQGTYQSPVLVQWKSNGKPFRLLDVTITRFK
jgi:thiamine phosphate synthase YjbQ (UPF0047 family)